MTGPDVNVVLVVDDDRAVRDALVQTLDLAGLAARAAGSFLEAKDLIQPEFAGVVLSDIRMPGRDGFHLLDHVRRVDADLPVILLTGEGDIPMAVRAMGMGAFGFLEKPCAGADLLAVLDRALRARAMVLDHRRLRAQSAAGDPAARLLFGVSAAAEALRARVRAVAAVPGPVLVTGPPGAGISKVSEVIHLSGPDAKGPFVKRAAAGLDPAALALLLDQARGGALFLDEIGALSPATQFALLEALEADAPRVIAGTTADLAARVAAAAFNADLFYRLDGLRVRIPALAERPEDIVVLFRHYVDQASEQAGLSPPAVTPDVVAALMARDWPGNARALMSVAMRFALGLGTADLTGGADTGLADQMARIERSLLIAALRRAAGSASAAAAALKLPRKTFYDKLARHAIRPEDFR